MKERKNLFWSIVAVIVGVICIIAVTVVVNSNDETSPDMPTTSSPMPSTQTTSKSMPPVTVTKTETMPPATVTEVTTVQLPPTTSTTNPLPEDCSVTLDGWNNGGPKGTGETYAPMDNEVVSVRIGQHACFDQVTIDINTESEVGSHFEYVPNPTSDGSGNPPAPSITGGAVLQGSVYAWSKNLKASGAPYTYGPEYFESWKALREVRCDVSHEGHTSFFIGTVANNAFRMRTWLDHGIRKVIIQIAH